MTKSLKYISIIVVCAAVIYLIFQFRNCSKSTVSNPGVTVVPKDTNFQAVKQEVYRIPWALSTRKNPKVKLPVNIKEKDVKNVITVETKEKPGNPVDIISTNDGGIYVNKDSSISSVTVTSYQPPFFDIGLKFGAGISLGYNNRVTVSPVVTVALGHWYGWLQAPVAAVDLDGLGLGMQAKLYNDIYGGAYKLWRYDSGSQIKLTLNYVF